MSHRIRALTLAHLAAWRAADPPVTALAMHGLVAAILCGLTRDLLDPLGYALFALAVSGALLVLPFLGELGFLMRDDPASEWSRALPATPFEQRVARACAVLVVLWILALGALVPALLLAPAQVGWLERAGLLAAGWANATALGGLLLAVQQCLSRRPGWLALVHSAAFGGLLFALLGLSQIQGLVDVARLDQWQPTALWYLPPLVFAAPFAEDADWAAGVGAVLGTLAGLALLVGLRLPEAGAPRGTDPLGWALSPLRRLLARTWVRSAERASFDLVFDALPHERETALRTRPLFVLPALFLWAAHGSDFGVEREGLLALLLFASSIYLPVIAAHVPTSQSHRARWILDGAPVPHSAIQAGALKALALRTLVPLYGVLFLCAGAWGGWGFAGRLTPIALLFALAVLRRTWSSAAPDLPFSLPTERAGQGLQLGGPLLSAAIAATFAAVFAARVLTEWPTALAATLVLLGFELWSSTRNRGPAANATQRSLPS